jgi:hypothetical protein
VGIGHVSWPAPREETNMTVSGVDVVGLAFLATTDSTGMILGFARERSVRPGPNGLIVLDCLDCDLANARPRGARAPDGDLP